MLKNLIKQLMTRTKKVVTLPIMRSSSGEFLLKKTDFGRINIEYTTIQKIAERAIEQVEGIREPEVTVDKVASSVTPIKIRLTLILAEGYSALKTSEAIDRAINDALKDLLNLEFYVPVDVKVKQIAQPVTQKRRRVR